MYDYLIVGSGLYGATFAYLATQKGKKCLIIEKRSHIGGNVYTEECEGIQVHRYGAHIFHTTDKKVWDFVNQFADFNGFINMPVALYQGQIYNMPFNMNTFSKMWGITTPQQAKEKIAQQIEESGITSPTNLEEQAIYLVGKDIYETLIKGYTEKQWGKPCSELPPFIIKRLPVRYTYDNRYFNDVYQGIPDGGYTQIIEKMTKGCDIKLNTDFFEFIKDNKNIAQKIVYTGQIDTYFNYCFGELEYRSLRFETETLDCENYQGNAVVNYTQSDVPYTRIIEHKHFEFGTQPKTIITKEYPMEWSKGQEAYYPVNDEKNNTLYAKYAEKAIAEENVIFGGRLGQYKYFDMDKTISDALQTAKKELK
ncbi:MAG: UDP-galactopyranose mutase [Acutalibacteraceae bacterium]|nr:UDP-galactopyranose mutase [Acutalibacteraceae bacterium]